MTKQKEAETRPEEAAKMSQEEGAVKRREQDDDMTPEETTKMWAGQLHDEFREKEELRKEQGSLR